MLEAVDEVIYEVEVGPGGRIELLYASAAHERVLGGRPEPGRSLAEMWSSLVHPADRPAFLEGLTRTRAGEDHDTEYRMRGLDGRERRMWVRHRASRRDGRMVGAGVMRDVTEARRSEAELRELVAEQAALRRVAEAVARRSEPETVFAAVAEEVQRLLGVPAVAIARMEPDGSHEIVAACGIGPEDAHALCEGVWRHGAGPAGARWHAGEDFGFDDSTTSESEEIRAYAGAGVRSYASTPVFVGGEFWGALALGSPEPSAIDAHGKARLRRLAGLVSLALDNAERGRCLAKQATTDPLTGLANHRLFHETLARDIARARRDGEPLAVALIDLDQFKAINDTLGHQAGDAMLRAVAGVLRGVAREGEMIARLGGDEFGVILPRTDDVGAEGFGRRLRRAVSATDPMAAMAVTVSVGGLRPRPRARRRGARPVRRRRAVLGQGARARRGVPLRQGGRGRALRRRARRHLARSQAHTALRSLVRALDLKDPSTHRHSERVADLADRFAACSGWSDTARHRLRAAALLHDLGKIVVPDRILHKGGPLEPGDYEVIKEHAAVGARIAAEALEPDQIAWIRHHHERWDGNGYPDGLAATAIPDGARILALADAYDVMTHSRHYREPLPPAAAADEVRRYRGTQFAPELVDRLDAALAATSQPA
jgi:diguanylate cyclase (GGDEF)-like protein/putative nucleotidyltransferase with HDIG domain/PAS domain S-box-containing protein